MDILKVMINDRLGDQIDKCSIVCVSLIALDEFRNKFNKRQYGTWI